MAENMAGPQPPSFEETMDAFDSVPLFMRSLPTEDSDDTALAAIQALVHEGTPDEIAQTFKENGNDYFKGRRFREALNFYTQGVDAKPTDPALKEALLCNRAACNLELKNYGSVLRDCSNVISFSPKCSKAYYRSALALKALERFEEAIDCCDRCLAFDSSNAPLVSLHETVLKLKTEQDRKAKEKADRERKARDEKRALERAYKERNILPTTSASSEPSPYHPSLSSSVLTLPVFFLYPQHAQSDTIAAFDEDVPFAAHIEAMFPPATPYPDWDKDREYAAENLVVYATTKKRRAFKVGKNMTLADVFKAAAPKTPADAPDGLELIDGFLTFTVVPKGGPERKWVDEFKKARESTL